MKKYETIQRKNEIRKTIHSPHLILALMACGQKASQADTYQEELQDEIKKPEAEAEALEAQRIRVMNNTLLEVLYVDNDAREVLFRPVKAGYRLQHLYSPERDIGHPVLFPIA